MLKKSDLSKYNIKKINSYMKIINESVYDYNEDVHNFKEESESNILIEIDELIKTGLSEDAAVKISLKNFGDNHDLIPDINDTFNKVYHKNILKISSIGIILGAALLAITFIWIFLGHRINFLENNMYMTRSTYKISLVLIATSLILFIIWEISNLILMKRSKNFIFKILPINLIGLIDFILILIYLNTYISNISILLAISLFEYFSLMLIPIFYYRIIRNKILF